MSLADPLNRQRRHSREVPAGSHGRRRHGCPRGHEARLGRGVVLAVRDVCGRGRAVVQGGPRRGGGRGGVRGGPSEELRPQARGHARRRGAVAHRPQAGVLAATEEARRGGESGPGAGGPNPKNPILRSGGNGLLQMGHFPCVNHTEVCLSLSHLSTRNRWEATKEAVCISAERQGLATEDPRPGVSRSCSEATIPKRAESTFPGCA